MADTGQMNMLRLIILRDSAGLRCRAKNTDTDRTIKWQSCPNLSSSRGRDILSPLAKLAAKVAHAGIHCSKLLKTCDT